MRTIHYERLTWPEIREATREERVVVVPVGTLEDHGHHLPIDTDLRIANEVCGRAVRLVPEHAILFPPVIHGYSPHHMDFPGTISIDWSTFVEHTLCITRSLARHGFKRILLVNGHGSNTPLVDMVTRLTIIEFPEVLCCATNWWSLAKLQETAQKVRESAWPGGMSHACELETSLYLGIEEGSVLMEKAKRDMNFPESPHFWEDLIPAASRDPKYRNPLTVMEWWSTQTETGAQGDPTLATREKGEACLSAAAEELADVILEVKQRAIRKRVDHHAL